MGVATVGGVRVRHPWAAVVGSTVAAPSVMAAAAAGSPCARRLILATFLKIGAVLFGSGYVLVALLRSELVDGLGWLTETQLLDAIAVGQATPVRCSRRRPSSAT